MLLVLADTWRIIRTGGDLPRRLTRLWGAAARALARRVADLPLVRRTVVLLLVVLVASTLVTGRLDVLADHPERWVMGGLAAGLAALLWRGSTHVRLLPFVSLAGESRPDLEAVAHGMAEGLDHAVRRISEQIAVDPFVSPAEVSQQRIPDKGGSLLQKDGSFGTRPARTSFQTGQTVAGVFSDLNTEVASIGIGPIRVSIGTLLNLAARLQGRAVRGTLVELDGRLLLSATRSGRQGRKWAVHSDRPVAEDVADGGATLVGELAVEMVWSELDELTGRPDRRAFTHMLAGNAHFQRFVAEGRLEALMAAEADFAQAIGIDPGLSQAYFNRGVVLRERVRQEDSLEGVASAAVTMWTRAVALDPDNGPAWLQLAIHSLERADEVRSAIDEPRYLLVRAVADHLDDLAEDPAAWSTELESRTLAYRLALERWCRLHRDAVEYAGRACRQRRPTPVWIAANYWMGLALMRRSRMWQLEMSPLTTLLSEIERTRGALPEAAVQQVVQPIWSEALKHTRSRRRAPVWATPGSWMDALLARLSRRDTVDLRAALRHLRRAETALRDERTLRIVQPDRDHDTGPLDVRLARSLAAQLEVRVALIERCEAGLSLLWRGSVLPIAWHRHRIRVTTSWADRRGVEHGPLHIAHAQSLPHGQEHQRRELALRAVGLDPDDVSLLHDAAALMVGDAVRGEGDATRLHAESNAARLLQIAVVNVPLDAAVWQLVAHNEFALGRVTGSDLAAGLAFMLDPRMWPDPESPTQDPVWRQEWMALSARDGTSRRDQLATLVRRCLSHEPAHSVEQLSGAVLAPLLLEIADEAAGSEGARETRLDAVAVLRQAVGRLEELLDGTGPGVRPGEVFDELADHLNVMLGDLERELATTNDERRRAAEPYWSVVNRARDARLVRLGKGSRHIPTVTLLTERSEVSRLSRAWYGLGQLLHEGVPDTPDGSQTMAEECYRYALQHSPRYVDARFELAEILRSRGQYDEAAREAARVAEIVPNWAAGHALYQAELLRAASHEVAEGERRTALLVQAKAEVRRGLQLYPAGDTELLLRTTLSEIHEALGEVEAAAEEQHTAVQLGRGTTDEVTRLCVLAERLQAQGKLVAAGAEYAKAWKLANRHGRPSDTVTLAEFVQCANSYAWFLGTGRLELERARLLAERAVRVARKLPDELDLLANCMDTRGWVAFLSGDLEEARRWLEAALREGETADRWVHLGHTTTALARRCTDPVEAMAIEERSRELWKHIIERFPGSPEATLAQRALDGGPAGVEPIDLVWGVESGRRHAKVGNGVPAPRVSAVTPRRRASSPRDAPPR